MGQKTFRWILLLYVILRWILAVQPGYVIDILAYKRWALTAAREGIPSIYENVDLDYPPLYAYILYPLGKAYLAVAPETPPGTLPDSTLLTLLIKLPPFLFDMLLAALLYLLVTRRRLWGPQRAGPAWGRWAALIYLFNPAVLWDSAYWGQADAIHSALVVASLFYLSGSRMARSGIALGLAGMMKPLAAPMAPLVAVAAFARDRWKGLLIAGLSGAGLVLLVLLPFILTGRGPSVLNHLLFDVDLMPYTTVNGQNLWWLLGPWQDATAPFLIFLTPTKFGLGMFVILSLLILYRAWPAFRNPADESSYASALFQCGAVIMTVFFFFSTHMHENHLFMAVPLTLALAGRSRKWAWFAAVMSFVVFLNVVLHDYDLNPTRRITYYPPFTWGGVSPVENLHQKRLWYWGELIGTYAGAAVTAGLLAAIFWEAWRRLPSLRAKTDS
jgi:Gpi18-like mannosyltransferase